jgi:hypothetical protein
MNLILPKHKENLTQLIGGIIEYGVIPNVYISDSAILPDIALNGENYDHFYNSSFIYLRVSKKDKSKVWLKIAPGPDSPINPWAPVWVEEKSKINFDELSIDKDEFIENVAKYEKSNEDKGRVYLDYNIASFGFTKLNCWGYKDKISSIKICSHLPYAAIVMEHESGKKWSIYLEYDFDFWLNFNYDLAEGIEKYSDEIITIKE